MTIAVTAGNSSGTRTAVATPSGVVAALPPVATHPPALRRSRTYIWGYSGSTDSFRSQNTIFAADLRRLGVAHETKRGQRPTSDRRPPIADATRIIDRDDGTRHPSADGPGPPTGAAPSPRFRGLRCAQGDDRPAHVTGM